MSQEQMKAIVSQLKLISPSRIVTRDLAEFTERDGSEKKKGVFTVLMGTESGYANHMGREAQLGTLSLSIIGQFELNESATGLMVEDEEHAMVNELKMLAQSQLPVLISGLLLQKIRHSMQIDRPFGWIISEWIIQ